MLNKIIINKSLMELNAKAEFWSDNHCRAWRNSGSVRSSGIASAIKTLAEIADDYESVHEGKIGFDSVLGEGWLSMFKGIRTLLNGEIGGLDGSTCNSLLFAIAKNSGFGEADLI